MDLEEIIKSASNLLSFATMSSDENNPPPATDEPNVFTHLGYRSIFWLTIGSLIIPIYLVACVLSIIKAHTDRKLIKTRILARKLQQPIEVPESPLDIIAKEVRKNRWHKRQSSMTLSKIQSLLKNDNDNGNSCSDDRLPGPHQADKGCPADSSVRAVEDKSSKDVEDNVNHNAGFGDVGDEKCRDGVVVGIDIDDEDRGGGGGGGGRGGCKERETLEMG